MAPCGGLYRLRRSCHCPEQGSQEARPRPFWLGPTRHPQPDEPGRPTRFPLYFQKLDLFREIPGTGKVE
jgi:hypothetical protein